MHSIRAIPIQTVSSYQFENSVTPSSCSSFSTKDWKLEKIYDPLSDKYRYQVKEIRSSVSSDASKKEMSLSERKHKDPFPSFENKIRQVESTRLMNPYIIETTCLSETPLSISPEKKARELLNSTLLKETSTQDNLRNTLESDKINTLEKQIQTLESDMINTLEKQIQTLESDKINTLEKRIQTLESDMINTLEKRIQTLESDKINTLEKRIQTLESDMINTLEKRIQTLESDMINTRSMKENDSGLTIDDRLYVKELEKKIEGIRKETLHYALTRRLNISFSNLPNKLSEHYIIANGMLIPYLDHQTKEFDKSIFHYGHLLSGLNKLKSMNIMVFYTGSINLSELTFNLWIKPFQENHNIPIGRIQMTKLIANVGRFVSQPMNETVLQQGILYMTVHIPMIETMKTLSLEYSIDIVPIIDTKRDRMDISFHQPTSTPKKSVAEKKSSNPLLFDSRTLDSQPLSAASFQTNEQDGQINYLLHFLKNGVSK